MPFEPISEETKAFFDVIYEEKVQIVETAGCNPKEALPLLRRNPDIKVMHKAPEIKFLKSAEALGVDAVVINGTECGGLPGNSMVTSMISWPKAADELKVPVIAAGGVCDGKTMAAALACGCEGVMVGTRFFMSEECAIGPNIKNMLKNASEKDTVLTQTSVNNACRSINNKAALEIIKFEQETHPTIKELYPLIHGLKTKKAYEEDLTDYAQISVGQDIGRINEVKSCKQIIDDMVREYNETMDRLASYR